MSKLKELEAFVQVANKGSLTAAAAVEGVTPAIIGRRLDALENHLGVRLLVRTTRKLTLTHEGQAFLEDCQRILNDLANAEAQLSLGSARASGHLRLTAPAGFGRKHVAPLLMEFLREHPEVSASLDLSDRTVDLVGEGFDCAVRLGGLIDSSLVAVRLGQMKRVVVGSPAYLEQRGVPRTLDDLAAHDCLSLPTQAGWDFQQGDRHVVFKPSGRFLCNDGAVLHDWALAGMGLAWRSLWEVGADLRWGRLVSVLDDFATPPVGIHAVFPQRRHLPLRVRLFIDSLQDNYTRPEYWDSSE
ncbi:MAG: LysR family transcriptional regulator [Gammaproteobacteria bacterium]|nr:LysR family transcriptional regulator [Gammaproteobacteria bacterium]MBU1415403.1 LysR family transcriptional regulator [Gammaproteobacteria bacterium]